MVGRESIAMENARLRWDLRALLLESSLRFVSVQTLEEQVDTMKKLMKLLGATLNPDARPAALTSPKKVKTEADEGSSTPRTPKASSKRKRQESPAWPAAKAVLRLHTRDLEPGRKAETPALMMLLETGDTLREEPDEECSNFEDEPSVLQMLRRQDVLGHYCDDTPEEPFIADHVLFSQPAVARSSRGTRLRSVGDFMVEEAIPLPKPPKQTPNSGNLTPPTKLGRRKRKTSSCSQCGTTARIEYLFLGNGEERRRVPFCSDCAARLGQEVPQMGSSRQGVRIAVPMLPEHSLVASKDFSL
uniref:Uncharacterized protein n=1 Tax=Pinguiococcus pyrenoidosus TaxID=172671 RepID=A0A7R9YCH1_9STRA|mmetsp:Transcript_18224/g.69104  ORF Transcript_18224/g.69104 Transcript_18224/m.69104 type:complete len:302 (+) Transcript_18224:152-1057(+)